jgi:hypothetical protein
VSKRGNVHAIRSGRRIAAAGFIMVAFSLGLTTGSINAYAALAETSQQPQASAFETIVQKAMKTEHLRAVIVKVTQGDKVVIRQAFGESITGVPASIAMHFRNGAGAFAYLGTLLMQFVAYLSFEENRHRRGGDLHAGSVRLAGELLELERHIVPNNRCVPRTRRSDSDSARKTLIL